MNKTKQIGVRFDISLLDLFKEDKIAETPQQALNYLTEFYRQNREKIDIKKLIEESSLFKPKPQHELKGKFNSKTGKTDDPYKGLSKGEILRKMREGSIK